MPSALRRYQAARQLHYITFTCYHRKPHLSSASAREVVESTLERVRRWYGFYINAYVVMPDHVHLLMSEPERGKVCVAIQMLKQIVARELCSKGEPFWQARYYDFNLWSDRKFKEKIRYIHRNPVRRGLVERPEEWKWSSFQHYATGVEGTVEIESQWIARKKAWLGLLPRIRRVQ